MGDEAKKKSRRGFAAMDPKLCSEISRKGGRAAHAQGTAHEFTTEEARVAGRKGGRASQLKRKIAKQGDVARCSCGAIFATSEAVDDHDCPLPESAHDAASVCEAETVSFLAKQGIAHRPGAAS